MTKESHSVGTNSTRVKGEQLLFLNNTQSLQDLLEKLSAPTNHCGTNFSEDTLEEKSSLASEERIKDPSIPCMEAKSSYSLNINPESKNSRNESNVNSDDESDEDDDDNDYCHIDENVNEHLPDCRNNKNMGHKCSQTLCNVTTHSSGLSKGQLSIDVPEDSDITDSSLSHLTVLKKCSQVQIGPQLHYHSPVTINQNFDHCSKELLQLQDIKRLTKQAAALEAEPYYKGDVTVEVTGQEFSNTQTPPHCVYKKLLIKSMIPGFLSICIILAISIGLLIGNNSDMKIYSTEGSSRIIAVDTNTNEDANLNKKLFQEISKNNLTGVKDLVGRGASLTARIGKSGLMPIHEAAYKGSVEIVKWFLDSGVPAGIGNYYGTTPLHKAAHGNHVEVAKLLLEHNVDVDVRRSVNNETPLHTAALYGSEEVAEYLIKNGADVNVRTSDNNQTPLHFAAKKGHLNVVKLLVSCGSDTTMRDKDNKTPLELAMESRNGKKPPKEWLLVVNWLSDINLKSESRPNIMVNPKCSNLTLESVS